MSRYLHGVSLRAQSWETRWHPRLSAHRQRCASGQVLVDGADLFGNVGEGLVEQLEALLLNFLEIVLGLLRALPGIFEVFLRRLESRLDALESLDGSHVRRHLLQFFVKATDLPLELFVDLVPGSLDIVNRVYAPSSQESERIVAHLRL